MGEIRYGPSGLPDAPSFEEAFAALTEDAPGSLCHEHGYRIPARKPAKTPRS